MPGNDMWRGRKTPSGQQKTRLDRSAVHARWKFPGMLPESQFEPVCGWPAGTLTRRTMARQEGK